MYSDEVMRNVRQNIGLDADDTSRDIEIGQMPKSEVFEKCLTWEGLIHFGVTIRGFVEDIYGVDLKD